MRLRNQSFPLVFVFGEHCCIYLDIYLFLLFNMEKRKLKVLFFSMVWLLHAILFDLLIFQLRHTLYNINLYC